MSELKKKRMRYEILEDVEKYLQTRIKGYEDEIEWRSAHEEGEEIPEWRLEEIQDRRDQISEIKEVIKALAKM